MITYATVMIGIVVALKCEALALIDKLDLKVYPLNTPFTIYYNQDIFLIISGIGKINAAAATSYLFALTGCKGWLNIGIGGHQKLTVGEGFLAHKVCDFATKRTFYPNFGWKLKEKTSVIITVDQVESQFKENAIYEMEAAGFYSVASRFSTIECIHCFKVISDNKENPSSSNAQLIKKLIYHHFPLIESLLNRLSSLIKDLSDPTEEDLAHLLKKWHFTVTEQYQLKRYLQLWPVFYPDKNIHEETFLRNCLNGKSVLKYLKSKIPCSNFST